MKNFFGPGFWKGGYKSTPTAKDYFENWGSKPNIGGGFSNILLVPLAIVFAAGFLVTTFDVIFIHSIGNTFLFKSYDATTRINFTRERLNGNVKGDIEFVYSERNNNNTWRCESTFIGKQDGDVLNIVLDNPKVYVNLVDYNTISPDMSINLNDNSTINIMGQRMDLKK
jgi:hypothetical protein